MGKDLKELLIAIAIVALPLILELLAGIILA